MTDVAVNKLQTELLVARNEIQNLRLVYLYFAASEESHVVMVCFYT